jgi:hypothetical protein
MPRGGKRAGAGKPKGTKHAATITKEAVLLAVKQRVMQNADKIVNAQLIRAIGSVMVFKVEEKAKGKPEHILVTDPETIKQVLDTGEGTNCSVDGAFYLVTEVPPETKAGDSLLDRTFGKAQQNIEVRSENDIAAIANKLANIMVQKHGWKPERAIKETVKAYKEQGVVPEQIVIEATSVH